MVINCYYEFPGNEWNLPHYFQSFFDKLKGHYPEYTFNSIDTRTLDERTNSPCCKYSHHHMIIENDSTKKYFLVSYWDKMNCIHEGTGWDIENCVEKITTSGTHIEDTYYIPMDEKFTPFSYLTPRSDSDDMIQKLCGMDNNERIIPDKPMFKGFLYGFRMSLYNDDRYDVQKTGDGNYFHYPDYIKHLNNYAINMSLNGAGQICYRDMEILGLGTALFRPKLSTNFYNPLIPDYHYISVDYDSIKDVKSKNQYYSLLSDLMINRWNEVIKDRDFINEVAKNGKKWFDENVPKEKHGEILLKILNFDKLL